VNRIPPEPRNPSGTSTMMCTPVCRTWELPRPVHWRPSAATRPRMGGSRGRGYAGLLLPLERGTGELKFREDVPLRFEVRWDGFQVSCPLSGE